MEMTYTPRTTCRICGSSNLTRLFSLGEHYISDFVEPGKAYDGPKCPIELVVCEECTLVQNPHTAPQELLYSGFYWYRSGVTQTMIDALADVVDAALRRVPLAYSDVVLDIGCNDGTLLSHYPSHVLRVGVEPASNFALVGEENWVDVFINDFWSERIYEAAINGQKAKVITAIGMFYDLEDPNQFIADVAKVLHTNGVFIAQLMCLQNMINVGDIGNLAHEHLEFYTLRSLEVLLGKHGLEIFDIETNQVNGESYRLFIRHIKDSGGMTQRVALAFDAEETILIRLGEFWERSLLNREEVKLLLIKLLEEKKSVWVYGASTKGNTLLQWYQFTEGSITGASERSPEKWGKVTAGSNLPIFSEEVARSKMSDYFLVLPYAFIDEFIEREKNQPWRLAGGKFIVPLPKLRII